MKVLVNLPDELYDTLRSKTLNLTFGARSNGKHLVCELIGCVLNGTVVEDENKAPEKTGRWIFKAFDEETGISNSYWCSACNYPMAQVYDDCCAHCGAKMERERR